MDITKTETESETASENAPYSNFLDNSMAKLESKKKSAKLEFNDYEIIFDNLLFPRLLLDDKNRVLQVNRDFKSFFNVSEDDVIGKDIISIFEGNLGIKIISKINELTEASNKCNLEISYKKQNMDHLFNVFILRLFQIKKAMVTFIDITKEKSTEDELKKRNKELLQLYEIGKTLQQTLDIDEILDITIKTFTQLGFDRVRVYFYDDLDHSFVGRKANDISNEKFTEIKVPVTPEHIKVYHSYTKKTPIIRKEEKYSIYSKLLDKEGVYESASLPLVNKGRVLGMISIDNKYSKKKIPEESLQALMTFTNQISVAIENAMLYASSIRRLNRLSAIYDITKISSTTFVQFYYWIKAQKCCTLK